MKPNTQTLLRWTTAAVLLAASSSAMAQRTTANLKFVYVSSTATNTSGENCGSTNPCRLQDILETHRGRGHDPLGPSNAGTAYLLAAGTYKVPLNFPESFGLALFYGGFAADFSDVPVMTDQFFTIALAARDLKINVTILSGDLNDNGIVDDGDAASVVTFTSHGQYTVFDGFHIEGATESAVKVVGSAPPHGSPTLRNLVIRGNAGDGLHLLDGTSSLSNVLIHGNGGTGLVVEGSAPHVTNLTITGNGGANTQVGGLSCIGSGESCGSYHNTIIWGNAGEEVQVSSESSELPQPSFHHALVQGCKGDGTWNPACGIDGGNNLADADPRFVDAQPCAAVPTLEGDYRLQTGSPALNVGDNTATTRPKDLDGLDRVQMDIIDLGPYEGSVEGQPVMGACGTANNVATSSAPTDCSLCATGSATEVIGKAGAWGWMCEGSNGGASSPACSAPYAAQTLTIKVNPESVTVGTDATVSAESTSGLKPTLSRSGDSTAGCTLGNTSNTATGVEATVSTQSTGVCSLLANHPGTGDMGDARFTAAQPVVASLTVTNSKEPEVPVSACDAFLGPNVNVIDLRAAARSSTARGVNGKFNVIYGSGFNDSLTGGNAGNCIDGGAGNDRLTAGAGENHLYGGMGNDTLTPGTGSTAMDGGEGTDRCGRASGRATTTTRTSCEL